MNPALEVRSAVQPLTLVETLAHELRQPLSAIESTAYYLSMVLPRGEKRAQEHALRLQRLVEQASWILSCALQLEDASSLAPEALDVEELITQTVAAHASAGPLSWRLDLAGNLPRVKLDPGRGRSLMRNLFAMMRRASDGKHPVRVRTASVHPRQVVLELSLDACSEARGAHALIGDAPRVSAEVCGDELESCLGAGASLGIESARRIVESHGGSFEIDFDRARGVRVRILFPAISHHGMLPCTVVV